jgi:CelD/BcsL family acetyltransferase involved in cellulose biosynthesis
MFKSISLTCRVDASSRILQRLERHRPADLMRVPLLQTMTIPPQLGERHEIRFRRSGDDYCIELPASAEEYLSRLGSQTRKHLPYYLRRLKKEWGNHWRLEQTFGRHITKESYRDLLALNRLRMDRKRRRSLWTEKLAEHRWGLASEFGSLESIRYKDRLIAGTLSFVYGKEAFLVVIAHDPEHDRLNLGNVCLWLTIEDLIARGYARYHLLWGNSPYKEQFGAVAHPLYEMTLFRNPLAARVWRGVELLRVEKVWGKSKSFAHKIAWFFPGASQDHRDKAPRIEKV